MWLAYAVAGMLSIGVADFSIALAGRRMERTREILSVSWLQHAVSWAGLACAVALLDEGSAGPRDYLLGIAAGAALGIGKPILFAGLSFATISIFAPITAVVSILVPVGFALAMGEQPGAWALLGIALCLPAVVLVSRDGGRGGGAWSMNRLLAAALAAGALLGVNAIAIGAMADDAGLLPILLAYAAAFVAISAIALAGGEPLLPTRAVRVPTAAAGLLDGGGFALIALALQQGLVSVAASLFALAPVVPVVLAFVFLRERLRAPQTLAVVLAFVAVVLMTIG